MPQLDNKTIVIVGGTTGLGLAAARAFVGEGARVVLVGRNADSVSQAESALGQAARGLAGDATDSQT
ncbi:MAG: SDR family NAD(P)-dependent oxidoreductase, partial [Verrucomicrobiia bacterium]